MASTTGRRVVEYWVNKSGGGVVLGDVVVNDSTNDEAFTTSTAGGVTGTIGVAQETIASNASGRVLTAGYASLVNVNASVTRGNFGKTHTVAKQATDAGSSRLAGAFCQFLKGGTTPSAHLFGLADASTSSSGTPAGTSFPGSPATSDLYFRTDRGILYYYDGTRWLSVQLYNIPLSVNEQLVPIGTTGQTIGRAAAFGSEYDLWLVKFHAVTFVTTTNTGSAYWTLTLYKQGGTTTTNIDATITTASDTASQWTTHTATIGALLGNGTTFEMGVKGDKTSTPGTLYCVSQVTARLVG